MERSPLSDRAIYPENEVIQAYLQEAFPAYTAFSAYLAGAQNGLDPAWMYYNNVKYWLNKVQHKKKTVFWLTVWEGYFKLSFYFTERHTAGIEELPIDPAIKAQHTANQASGKVRPVILDIAREEQLQDAYRLIEFKKSLK